MAISVRLPVAHHDGSEVYVAQVTPVLGQSVPVKVWVSTDSPYDGVILRTVIDGEQAFEEAELVDEDQYGRTYRAFLPMNSPVMTYRFMLLARAARTFDWLNAREITPVEPSDAYDFQLTIYGGAPEWARHGAIYQIFPDRFARSEAAEGREVPDWAVPRQWNDPVGSGHERHGNELYGGDLDGIIEHLDHIVSLGIKAIYLTPIFPAGSTHRYDAATFDRVDPLLGDDDALSRLTAAAHERGLRVLGDLTTNHTGVSHEWFRLASADPQSEEATFYFWHDHPREYVGWLGHASLPKLNWQSDLLRRRLVDGTDSVVAKWMLPPFNLDGWRIDVANMTGRYGEMDLAHEVARMVHKTATDINPEALIAGEHFFDASEDLRGDGWMCTMNYAGFTRPVWSWLLDPERSDPRPYGPMPMPQRPGSVAAAAMREFAARIPWQVFRGQWNILGSHDTVRIRTLVGSAEKMRIAAGLMVTYPGTPMVFAGDEWALQGTFGEDSRVPMPWDNPDAQDLLMWESYRELLSLRATSSALCEGGLRWLLATDDALVFLRESASERLLIVAARGEWEGATLMDDVLQGADPQRLFGDLSLQVGDDGSGTLGGDAGFAIWSL